MRRIAVIFTMIICIATSVVAIDIHHDRKYQVHILGSALLLEKPYPIDFGNLPNKIIRILSDGEKVKVLRITDEEGMLVIWARTIDGTTGYLIQDKNIVLEKG